MKERINPPSHVVAALKTYFDGKRCVAQDGLDAMDIDWHHIDDQPWNSLNFANFVPLGKGSNQTSRGALGYASIHNGQRMHRRLQPRELLRRAEILYYDRWDCARAYGAARLAFYIELNYLCRDADVLLYAASKSFQYAQYRWMPRHLLRRVQHSVARQYDHPLAFYVLSDILARDVLPVLRGLVASSQKRALTRQSIYSMLRSLSSVVDHHGHHDQAKRIYKLIKANKLEEHLQRGDTTEWLAYRRREVMFDLKVTATQDTENQIDRIRDELLDFRSNSSSGNLNLGIDLNLAHILTARGRYRDILELLLPAVAETDFGASLVGEGHSIQALPGITPWNVVEIFNAYTVALLNANKNAKGRRFHDRVADLTHLARMMLERTGYPFSKMLFGSWADLASTSPKGNLLNELNEFYVETPLPLSLLKKISQSESLLKKLLPSATRSLS